MRLAEDFRSIARDALNGKWKIAVLVDRLEGSFENLFAYFSDWKTTAAFYREVSGTECKPYEHEGASYTNQFYEEV